MAITISGSGIVEANLADNAVTLAKMASGTDGEILTYDASGNPVAVSVGTDGQVLTSTGVGSPPAFEAAAAGGKVLQVVQTVKTNRATFSSGSTWLDTGLTVNITPTSSTSKILIMANVSLASQNNSGYGVGMRLLRGSTVVDEADADTGKMIAHSVGAAGSNDDETTTIPLQYLDSPTIPGTPVAITYKIQGGARDRVGWAINRAWDNADTITWQRIASISTIIVMEIGA